MKQKQLCAHPDSRPFVGRYFPVLLLSVIIVFAFSCKKEVNPEAANDSELNTEMAKTLKSPTIDVRPGNSIQAAINTAVAGSVIKIKPGTYLESITINKPNLTLVGEGNVIIKNPGSAPIGIVVQDEADGFTLKNVTLQDFGERGLNMTYVDGFLLSHVTTISVGEYGLFSEYCKNGTIEHCEGTGHAETSMFVGQSTNVTIKHNKSYANVIGFEVENSSYVTLDKNHAYDNAVGILCLLVPGRTIKESSNITLTKNQVSGNNHPNFSAPPEMESVLPSGIGILIVGVDKALVQGNHANNNQFTGIALVSTLIIGALANLPPAAFGDIEPNPDYAKIIGNKAQGNGFNPPAGLPLPGADLLWDASGNYNCWANNVYNTSFPSPLPACQ